MAGEILPRETISQIVQRRNKALELYSVAYEAIAAASYAMAEADKMAASAAPMKDDGRFTYHLHETINKFRDAVKLPDREFYLKTARRITDTCIWSRIIALTGIEQLMDKQAAKDLHNAMMAYEPDRAGKEVARGDENQPGMPEISEGNIVATLEGFIAQSDMIFRRGVANVFSKLDRRFRSHDGFKIGSRIILDHAFNESGRWNYHWDHESSIRDIERVFSIIEDRPILHRYASILQAIDNDRRGKWEPHFSETDSEYFRIRIFKNGNAHMWFKRKDLLERVNKLLAEYYGEVIGEGQPDTNEDVLKDRKTSLAKNFGFFPTPDAAAETLIAAAKLYRRQDDTSPPLRSLEPSAGTGQLARRAVAKGCIVDCVEVQPALAAGLAAQGIYRKVMAQDFLSLSPQTTGFYDRIIMNPPFDRERDIDHFTHAWEFLKPDGMIVAIMSAGTEFRQTRKAIAFREFLERHKAQWRDLPAGSFSESGTNINTCIIAAFKDGRGFYWS